MSAPKRPKFSVGDIVVNTLYGTVGTVTDIQQVDGTFLYEINHGHSLFAEQTLVLLSEFTGDLWIAEEIEIELPFFLGEIVRVRDYGGQLFKVVGVRTEIYRYYGEGWEETIYELKRLTDGWEIEVHLEDMIPLADGDETSVTLVQDIVIAAPMKASIALPPAGGEKSGPSVDDLLDMYNDYKALYEWFGDDQYKRMMETVVQRLQTIVNYHNRN
ncbi:hypothetical protein P9199_02495 [Geobacillus stearothermophilus]|uniref:hypothetical protein n=1 Tax=Geobacillus TaxID=129337 RepID=UPI0005CD1B05|nr:MULTISPECIES: hypothetical protein [Geobacillus]ASS85873.1 hypothetical protein GLN3_01240 [Geobacillus lituanicus]MED0655466.1 hypothetical protein [Anoxybacillus geothermalis]KZE93022.1 hypothetical protein AVP43_03000 [Geobacillus stearothermophilus]MED4269145.1 hypothetical protein [Geobacillus stearothermophilus]MED5075292.1 hypothetical protein [Anoxybacillus geothermalis]